MSTETATDRVAAYLAEVRERACDEDIPRLLAAVEKVLEVAAKHEHGATRWEDPLPVPSWILELRETISRALLGTRREMSDGHKTFRCRKCGSRGDVKWLATHGHNRVSAFVLGLLGRTLGRDPKGSDR